MKIEKILEDSSIKKFSILVAAAGTGGHIYPGLSIANYFLENNCEVFWAGTKYGMENDLVDKEKFNFFTLPMRGVRGKGFMNWVKAPFFLFKAFYLAFKNLKEIRPNFVILMGGYICFPIALASKLLSIHIIIHEQNTVPGLTNRILSCICNKTFLGFSTKKITGEIIGNPIRNDLYDIEKPDKRFSDRSGPLRILIIGGSLGAAQFNKILPKIFHSLKNSKKIKVIHQSGIKHYKDLVNLYKKVDVDVEVKDFLHDMKYHYSWADLVIARSGAITVSELSEIGIASILVPYPFAVDNHQYYNAKTLEQKNAAFIIFQDNLKSNLSKIIKKLTREKCKKMAINANQRRSVTPSYKIYEYCLRNYAG